MNAPDSADESTPLREILATLNAMKERIEALVDSSQTKDTRLELLLLNEIQNVEARDSKRYFPGMIPDELYCAVALAGEVGEVSNYIKKYRRGSITWAELIEHMRQELPDVLIYLVMLADAVDVWLGDAYLEKKAFNEDRFGNPTDSE